MKITADQGVCVGSGQCVLAAANIFDQRAEDGLVVLMVPEPPPEERARVRTAVSLCPSGAIKLVE